MGIPTVDAAETVLADGNAAGYRAAAGSSNPGRAQPYPLKKTPT